MLFHSKKEKFHTGKLKDFFVFALEAPHAWITKVHKPARNFSHMNAISKHKEIKMKISY